MHIDANIIYVAAIKSKVTHEHTKRTAISITDDIHEHIILRLTPTYGLVGSAKNIATCVTKETCRISEI